MSEMPSNPFEPIEMVSETKVERKKDNGSEEKDIVNAKRYYVRYLVGVSTNESFVDHGEDEVATVEDKIMLVVPAIHRMKDSAFHFNHSRVETVNGKDHFDGSVHLGRVDACGEHERVEVAFESPGVECCAMSKEEAEKFEVPVQYMAGYLLGKDGGYIKVAQVKTIMDGGDIYYDNIHIIPEPVVRIINCLA
ncbi:MAG: hypothetical protein JSW61_01605 [Candidatus Thorarchaeota archaeon]|nr:MAG: hypothetical protein JSW61_01605 [Candidatus Thorarchaeota archaeon]